MEVGDSALSAEPTKSSFEHIVADISDFGDRSSVNREIVAEAIDVYSTHHTIVIAFCAIGSLLACAVIIGLVMHRHKVTGSYPKGQQDFIYAIGGSKDYNKELEAGELPRMGFTAGVVQMSRK